MTLAVEGIKPIDYIVHGAFGLEYAFSEMAFIRYGNHIGHDTAGASLGFGINYNGIKINYAMSDYNKLGSTSQFGLEFEF